MIRAFLNIGRTGTKVMILWLIFTGMILIWLLVIAPFIPIVARFVSHFDLPAVIGALLGSSGLLGGVVEIRKAIENKS